MACETHKMASAMHTIVFVDWALEAAIFDRLMERKKAEPNEQRSDRNRQNDENSDFKLQLRVQKVGFLMQNGVG